MTLSTVSGHLARLERAGLVAIERQGRHRYFRLADPDVAVALEGLMPVATRAGHLRVRTGPRDPELRRARSCYDHLAGDLSVKMFDRFIERKLLARRGDSLRVTGEGRRFFAKSGIDVEGLENSRRAVCRPCLDWSERRTHLGGTLGAAILRLMLDRGLVARERNSRVVRFSPAGEQQARAWFSR